MTEVRYVFGSKSRKWESITSTDRDWQFGVSKKEMERLKGVSSGRLCPACSADGIDIYDNIRECRLCKAIFSTKENPIPIDFAILLVKLDERGENNDNYPPNYFDFFIKHSDGTVKRIHGWYNTTTKRVVQIG